MKKWLILCCAAALFLAFASGAALASGVVTDVRFPEDFGSVDVGQTVTVDAIVTPADTGATVRWSSSRSQYATVRALDGDTCVIQGKRMGSTKITAKVGGKTFTKMLYVRAPKASSIKLNAKSVTLNPSGNHSTYTLTARLTPTYHSDSVEWSTSDETIVSLAPNGNTCVVTARADGSSAQKATVTATLTKAKKSASATFTVTKIPEKYVRISTRTVVPLYSGRTLTATVYPTNAFNQTVAWEVIKNPDRVKLTDNGDGTARVEGVRAGTSVIRVTAANGKSATCTVTVKLVRLSSLSVTPSSKTVEKDKTYEIKIKRSPTYVSYPDVTITSSNESVATVKQTDGKWIVTGTGRGYAKLYVSADNGRVKRTLSVRVLDYTNPTTVTVSAIGDVMLGGDPRKSSFGRFEDLWKKGSGYFFAKIKSELKGISIANLEMPLINTSKVANGSRSYIFRGKTTYAQALKAGGVDAVDLDNNHIMDYGSSGYNSTRSAVSGQGIGSFGRGKVCYITQNGVKVGFAGFRPESISLSKMKSSVKALKQRCDVAVISFHWGTEYRYKATASQVAYGRAAVQAGADLVLGHGPHVVGGIELYRNKHIVYSLGTIISTVTLPDDTDCFIYRHTFAVTDTSKGVAVSNAGFDIVPATMSGSTSYNDAQPQLESGSAASKIVSKIKSASPDNNPF